MPRRVAAPATALVSSPYPYGSTSKLIPAQPRSGSQRPRAADELALPVSVAVSCPVHVSASLDEPLYPGGRHRRHGGQRDGFGGRVRSRVAAAMKLATQLLPAKKNQGKSALTVGSTEDARGNEVLLAISPSRRSSGEQAPTLIMREFALALSQGAPTAYRLPAPSRSKPP
ncbi:hypothetical protein HMN09_00212100 [Mycena chlorophos]|uniref:Uncharacterized protein n=1 Tax=Mycena chlorophos TaxID=658473 RepID=A0A8H6TQ07_MYCCL|nr:hypothetical protein HMN09_00212100 [Mycena chlorophos]